MKFIPYDNFLDYSSQFDIRKKSWACAYNTAIRVGEEYDCLLYEMLFFLGDVLSKKLNLPSIRFFSSFALNQSVLEILLENTAFPMNVLKFKFGQKIISKILFNQTAFQSENLAELLLNSKPLLNIVFTTYDFQICHNTFDREQFYFAGCSMSEKNYSLKKQDSNQLSLIYISLGTMLNRNPDFYKKCIEAFKDESAEMIHQKVENFYSLSTQ